MSQKTIILKNNNRILLRHILKEDLDDIWDNYNEVIEEGIYQPSFTKVIDKFEKISWYNELVGYNNLCIVAEYSTSNHKTIVGQCTIHHDEWEASEHVGLLGIIISKSFRNLGLGCHLIEFAIEESKKNGKMKIVLGTLVTNTYAIHLYEKLGFRKIGIRQKQFYMKKKYIDELLMEKWVV
ncbi:MAG: GNAT family N-acetyltransferase [Candidatus Lokiarchaeota archaeon]|nr:GNAT family N-acetyltransferase [Candidatus Lokiarchaeota archaeon]